MPNFIISADHLSDLAIEGISDLINIMRELITKGGSFVIEQKSENAPPQEIKRFTTLSEIDAWEVKILGKKIKF
jgi:hypothetical protein